MSRDPGGSHDRMPGGVEVQLYQPRYRKGAGGAIG